ncbi:Frag1/DRAM/Sfk1 [Mycena amicta]|nr:Frag1/DRAM/Sfk1 [Mycena amicta]
MPQTREAVHHPKSHWWYVWIPVFSAVVWFGTILALLVTWLAEGGTHRPRYSSQDQRIAYISDVGADFLKPLFITGCSITAVTFFLSLSIERYLRHSGRLAPTMRRRETAFSVLAVFGSFLCGLGLILLSIFDTKRFVHLHRGFLLLFMVGVALSALFTVVEYRWISKDYEFIRQLRVAYIAKGLLAFVLVVLAVAFGVTLVTEPNVGAVLEWTISLLFTSYLLTFYYDLRQAKGVHKGQLNAQTMRNQRRWATVHRWRR